MLISLILEGVFERVPNLKVVLVEGGLAWAAALGWRMDRQWKKLKQELPHLKRAPSEYIRTNVWFTTQPIEEPEPRSQLAEAFDWIGWDRVLFATDYPHWDFDDPAQALPIQMTEAQKQAVFRENAMKVYRAGVGNAEARVLAPRYSDYAHPSHSENHSCPMRAAASACCRACSRRDATVCSVMAAICPVLQISQRSKSQARTSGWN